MKILNTNLMKYLLILSCLLFTSVGWSKDNSIADLEAYKKSVKVNLSKMDIKEYVVLRAFNNTFSKYCQSDPNQKIFNIFNNLYLKEFDKRQEEVFSDYWHGQYNAHKRFLKKFRKRVGVSSYCNCILVNIFTGGEEGQKCLTK